MKYWFFVTFLFYGQLYAQDIDSIHIHYYAGFDCNYEKDEAKLRGACIEESDLYYYLNKNKYRLISHTVKNLFLPYEDRFLPNIISDSLKSISISFREKIDSDTLKKLLLKLTEVKTNTLFKYDLNKMTNEFLEINKLTDKSKEYIDSVFINGFETRLFSTSNRKLSVCFKVNYIEYTLFKSENVYWILTTEIENVKTQHYLYWFDLDRFLYEKLPQNFRGSHLLLSTPYLR